MRKIVLLVLEEDAPMPGSVPAPPIDYVNVIRECIRRPANPQTGADIVELRKGIRILDALEKSDGILELEEADWEHLKEKVLGMQWNVIDERIVKFVDDIIGATDKAPLNGQVMESISG